MLTSGFCAVSPFRTLSLYSLPILPPSSPSSPSSPACLPACLPACPPPPAALCRFLPATFVSHLEWRGNASLWAHKWPILRAGWDWCPWSSCADLLPAPTGEWEITLCSAGEDEKRQTDKTRQREGERVKEGENGRGGCHVVDDAPWVRHKHSILLSQTTPFITSRSNRSARSLRDDRRLL